MSRDKCTKNKNNSQRVCMEINNSDLINNYNRNK